MIRLAIATLLSASALLGVRQIPPATIAQVPASSMFHTVRAPGDGMSATSSFEQLPVTGFVSTTDAAGAPSPVFSSIPPQALVRFQVPFDGVCAVMQTESPIEDGTTYYLLRYDKKMQKGRTVSWRVALATPEDFPAGDNWRPFLAAHFRFIVTCYSQDRKALSDYFQVERPHVDNG